MTDDDCPCWKCRRARFWQGFKRFFNMRARLRRYNCGRDHHRWRKNYKFWNVCNHCGHDERNDLEPATLHDYIKVASESLVIYRDKHIMSPLTVSGTFNMAVDPAIWDGNEENGSNEQIS